MGRGGTYEEDEFNTTCEETVVQLERSFWTLARRHERIQQPQMRDLYQHINTYSVEKRRETHTVIHSLVLYSSRHATGNLWTLNPRRIQPIKLEEPIPIMRESPTHPHQSPILIRRRTMNNSPEVIPQTITQFLQPSLEESLLMRILHDRTPLVRRSHQ